jgi:hypothetical protein
MRTHTLAVTCALAIAGASGALLAQAKPGDCVVVSPKTRLVKGTAFRAPIQHGFEFRLSADWSISVGPVDRPDLDYLWVVSPPLRTAPQLMIGAGYGLTARESVGFARSLRFVLTHEDYLRARSAIETDLPAGDVLKRLDDLGKGWLTLIVSDSKIQKVTQQDGMLVEALEWIKFRAESCVPRGPLSPQR